MKRISAKRTVLTSFLVDVLDIIINGTAAIITGSVVMLAETLQGAADLTVDVMLLIGLNRSKRPRDKTHPFGYGREMYIWTLFAALAMLVLVAGLSIYFGLQRLTDKEPIVHLYLTYAVLVLSIATNGYAFSVSFRRLFGKNAKSLPHRFAQSPMVESKTAFISDLIGVLAAMAGLIALVLYGITGRIIFDGLGAIIIGLFMAGFALILMRSSKSMLVGQSASPEVLEKIRQATLEIPEVQEVLDLRATNIGVDRLLINIEIHLQENLLTEKIEKIIDAVKEHIKRAVPEAYHVQVELETPDDEL